MNPKGDGRGRSVLRLSRKGRRLKAGASKLTSITGQIVELRAVNQHIVLVIDGTAPDGRTGGLWAFEGQPPNAFRRRHQDYKERLKVGTTITITGWAARDPQARAFSGNTVTFADGTTMVFGSTTPGASDGWRCSSGPCPYTYPDVRTQ